MAKADNGQSDIDSSFGDEMLDAALDDAIDAAVAAGEEALAEVAASNAQRNSDQMEVPLITSGILDIKKLSESYAAERALSAPAVPISESVPMLGDRSSARSFHVLAPTSKEEESNRWLYFALGFGAAVLLTSAVAIAVYFLALRGDGPAAPQLAAAPDIEQTEPAPTPDSVPIATVSDPDPAVPAVEPEPEAETEPTPASEDADRDDDEQRDDDKDRTRDRDRDRDDDNDRTRDRDKDRDDDKDRKRDRDKDRDDDGAVAAAPDPEPTKNEPADDPACDKVECLMNPSKPCCVKLGLGQTENTKPSAEPKQPERPSRADVAGAIGKVKGRVQSCADRYEFTGTVRIKFTVTPGGDVSSANTQQGTSSFQSCVADVVRSASFPETQKGITVTYPLLIK